MSGERLTRAQAIRAKCLECCAGQKAEVRKCEIKTCAWWRYRLGKEIQDGLYAQARQNKKTTSTL